MNENAKQRKSFVGFEYREITTKKSMGSVYLDSYQNFGWVLDGTSNPIGKTDCVTLKFKRDRKIRNKTEVIRLQRQFEAYVNEIIKLECSKKTKASLVAYIVGVAGTAFMTGSVFAVTAGRTGLSITFGIPGFVGWIASYLLFRKINQKKTEQIDPIIFKKYDELYKVCEKANSILNS